MTIPRAAREALTAAASDEHGETNRACCAAESDCTAEADCSANDDQACRTCHDQNSDDGGLHFVFGFEAQQCQGLSLLWIASGITLPAAAIDWEFDWLRVGDVCWPPCNLLAIASPPPVPPPQ